MWTFLDIKLLYLLYHNFINKYIAFCIQKVAYLILFGVVM